MKIAKMFKVKKVHKHIQNGRTYAHTDGVGYRHYTKGFKKRSISSERMSECATKLLAFLGSIFEETKTEGETA